MRIGEWVGRVKLELPALLRDAPGDLLDWFGRPIVHLPIPPRRLRAAVGRTSAREEYLQAGAVGAMEVLSAFCGAAGDVMGYPSWLDFGCGSGRLSRYLRLSGPCRRLVGVDVDAEAIGWATRHVPGAEFLVSSHSPPLPLVSESMDVVVAASVFTHFSEDQQFAWLQEIARVLRVGGLLLASTHSALSFDLRDDMASVQRTLFESAGYLFLPAPGAFNANAAYHSRSYLERNWSPAFRLKGFLERGLFEHQDLGIWERQPDEPAAG